MEEKTLESYGIKIVEFGSGEPIIVIPGAHVDYHNILGFLQKLAQRYKVITFNFPTKQYIQRIKDISPDDYVQVVDLVLENMNLESAFIAGQSFGGGIDYYYALLRPEKVKGVIAISPMVCAYKKNIVSSYISLLKGIAQRRKFDKKGHPIIEVVKGMLDFNTTMRVFRLIKHFDLSSKIQNLKVKSIAFIGQFDKLVDPIVTENVLRKSKRIEIIKIPNIGHSMIQTVPDLIVEKINFFIISS